MILEPGQCLRLKLYALIFFVSINLLCCTRLHDILRANQFSQHPLYFVKQLTHAFGGKQVDAIVCTCILIVRFLTSATILK